MIDRLKWVLYADDWYTPICLMDTPSKYFNNKDKIVGGVALTLKGEHLKAYKQAYMDQYGEVLKGSTLIVLDKVRAQAYLDYCYPPSEPISNVATVESSNVSPNGVLDELMAITKEKNLHWVPYEGKMYLIMVEASNSKGVEKDDYSSNWGEYKLPGEARLLEGTQLHDFKAAYTNTYGTWPYPRARSIRIGDWEHVYSYLVQGKSTTANTFQSMGAKSIERQATLEAPPCPATWTSEEGLVRRVFELMELSTIKMQRELCIVNTLANTPTTRRLDAIEYITDDIPKVHVYEFKKGAISVADITNTIAVKGYLHLVRELYPTSKVCLFLVGNGVEPQAQLLLEAMHGVMYLPLSTLLNRILQDIVSSWPKEGLYQLRTHFLPQFQDILPPAMLRGPIPHQPILTTYHKPMAGHCR